MAITDYFYIKPFKFKYLSSDDQEGIDMKKEYGGKYKQIFSLESRYFRYSTGIFTRINLFQVNIPVLYLLKSSEKLQRVRKLYVFRGYRSGTLVWIGLNKTTLQY